MGLVADTLTVKTHTIGTHLTEMTRTITFMTGWYLGIVFDEYLIFAKPEAAGDWLGYSYTIMAEAVVDVWGQRVFTTGVMEDFAKGSNLIMARSESSKGASYMVRKGRGLSMSCSAKCSVSTRKELRRKILSLAEIDLNVTIHTYIHTLLLPPQLGFSGTII